MAQNSLGTPCPPNAARTFVVAERESAREQEREREKQREKQRERERERVYLKRYAITGVDTP
jgi:hypothetical protein